VIKDWSGNRSERALRGFTLIELLIVVAIIAILAAIAVPNFLEAQTRAKVSRTFADMRSLATAIEAYAVDANFYPPQGAVNLAGAVLIPAEDPREMSTLNTFLAPALTTPVAYFTSLVQDPFADLAEVPSPELAYYHYKNYPQSSVWLRENLGMIPAPFSFRNETWGAWTLRACGPDRDRQDICVSHVGDTLINGYYDPTNGTISDGDVLRTQRFTNLGGTL
jgi:general secretion pathway protein G